MQRARTIREKALGLDHPELAWSHPCLRLFPGDDFVWILAIFFKTPVEFVQLHLGTAFRRDWKIVSSPEFDRQGKLVSGRMLLQLGNRLLDHVDQNTVQRAITQLEESVPVWGSIVFPPIQGRIEGFTMLLPAEKPAWNENSVDILASRGRIPQKRGRTILRFQRI